MGATSVYVRLDRAGFKSFSTTDLSRYTYRGTMAADMNVTDTQFCKLVCPSMAHEDVKEYPQRQYAILAVHLRERVSGITHSLRPYISPAAAEQTVESIISCLHQSRDRSIEDIVEQVKCLVPPWKGNERKVLDIINSAISLAAMVNVHVRWSDSVLMEAPLEHLIDQKFSPAKDINPCSISSELTMSYLAENYEFSVRWTDYLDEHLDINWGHRVVSIFQHKVWLAAQIHPKSDTLLSLDVVEEALDTLNILFPHLHDATASFMERHGQEFHRLGSLSRKPRTEVRDYKYWGGKIEQLMGELSKPPRGFRQLRPDRRNVLNPVNFWVAAGLACLAFLSSIAFGAVSVYYAKRSLEVSEKSLELSRLQYLLSVAQACSTPDGNQSFA